MSDPYGQAIGKHGLEDVQPRYRQFLLELKAKDSKAYEGAVARYKTHVEGSDPNSVLDAWIGYGAWLAAELAPGELVTIDRKGRSRRVEGTKPLGALLIQIPDDNRERALPVTIPIKASTAQQETVALLCR